jgi:PTH1 family peptidyl-tRNA hydrolase
MNRSGRAIKGIMGRSKIVLPELIVVCDSLDLPVGSLRLRRRGSSGGHNGLKSLIAALGGEDFMRLSIGIGRPGPGTDVVSHVLGGFESFEGEKMEEVVRTAAGAVLDLVSKTPESVMNELNRT